MDYLSNMSDDRKKYYKYYTIKYYKYYKVLFNSLLTVAILFNS